MPLPTDVDLVNLCDDIYTNTSGWDYLDHGLDDGVYFGLKKLDDCDVIVFRGSITPLDWWRDLRANPVEVHGIGTVHDGFHIGLDKMWAEVQPMLTQPVLVTGHSLGAARADILTAIMVAANKPPIRRVVFGEPRPGLEDLAEKIRQVDGPTYRNSVSWGHDRVCDVPLRLYGKLDFVHPKVMTDVSAAPSGDLMQKYEMFSLHHIQLYQQAVAAKFKMKELA
jgi:Lipase (class 3)